MQTSPQARKKVAARPTILQAELAPGLHQVYDKTLEIPMPQMMGRPLGELVFRDLYPFSGAFGSDRRMYRNR